MGAHNKRLRWSGGRKAEVSKTGSRGCSIRNQDVGLSPQTELISVQLMRRTIWAVQTYSFDVPVNKPAVVEVL